MSALDLLLASDPQYAALYNDTLNLLSEAEAEAETSIARGTKALNDAKAALEDTLSRAARLENGTRVFRDENGAVWDGRGNRVSDDAAASVVWNGNEPTHAEYMERKRHAADVQNFVDDWRNYQTSVLGAARNQLSDPNNPPSREELEEVRQKITEQRPQTQINETSFDNSLSTDGDKPSFQDSKPVL